MENFIWSNIIQTHDQKLIYLYFSVDMKMYNYKIYSNSSIIQTMFNTPLNYKGNLIILVVLYKNSNVFLNISQHPQKNSFVVMKSDCISSCSIKT